MDRLFCQLGKTVMAGKDVVLVQPLTYMNLSGRCLVAVKQWFKVDLEDFLVIHDDVSLPLGRIRFQKSGGAGGQHGIESIIESLGGKTDFDRLKFGVGPDPGGERRADYVLSAVPAELSELLVKSESLAADGVKTWLKEGMLVAMNNFNGIDLVPKPPKPPKPPKTPPAEREAVSPGAIFLGDEIVNGNEVDASVDSSISAVDADRQIENS